MGVIDLGERFEIDFEYGLGIELAHRTGKTLGAAAEDFRDFRILLSSEFFLKELEA